MDKTGGLACNGCGATCAYAQGIGYYCTNPKCTYERDQVKAMRGKMHRVADNVGALQARITALEASLAEAEGRVKELEAIAINEREDNLWNAYAVGHEADGLWTHLSMSDAEDLVRQCGLDVKARYYDASVIKAAIPAAARNVLPIRALASDALLDRQGDSPPPPTVV